MAPGDVSVVFYNPHYGNYEHWALWWACEVPDQSRNVRHHLYQVVGQHPRFTTSGEVSDSSPVADANYKYHIALTAINSRYLSDVDSVVKETDVDNETVQWDCQDYVIEMVDRLLDVCVIDFQDDEEEERDAFEEAFEQVKSKRGPMS